MAKKKNKESTKLMIFGIFIFALGALMSYSIVMFGGGAMMIAAILPPSGNNDDPI